MMSIRYNIQRSSFAQRIEDAIRESGDVSRAVQVELEPGGYNRDTQIEIGADDPHYFRTEWSGKDQSRFSARLRAAATALRDRRLYGRYHASHKDGTLVLRRA